MIHYAPFENVKVYYELYHVIEWKDIIQIYIDDEQIWEKNRAYFNIKRILFEQFEVFGKFKTDNIISFTGASLSLLHDRSLDQSNTHQSYFYIKYMIRTYSSSTITSKTTSLKIFTLAKFSSWNDELF